MAKYAGGRILERIGESIAVASEEHRQEGCDCEQRVKPDAVWLDFRHLVGGQQDMGILILAQEEARPFTGEMRL